MKKTIGLTFFLLLSSVVFAADQEPKSTPVENTLVTINGRAVTGLDMLLFNAQQGGKKIDSEQAQVAVMNSLINTLVLAQEAESSKLADDPQVKAAVDIARIQVLAEIQMRTYLEKNPVSDELIKAAYDTRYSPENMMEYNSSHILVDSEDAAKKLISELDKGASFAELAKEHSLDASKNNGGNLGWLEANQVVKPYGDALKTLEKGKYNKSPIPTQFGWHVILLEDSRPKQPPALEEVKAELSAALQRQQLTSYVSDLRNQAKIEVSGAKEAVEQPEK